MDWALQVVCQDPPVRVSIYSPWAPELFEGASIHHPFRVLDAPGRALRLVQDPVKPTGGSGSSCHSSPELGDS